MGTFLWVILAFCGFGHAFLGDDTCPRRHHALLIALLPIHGGFDCRELVEKGVQQRIALEAAVEDVNTEYDLQIALKVWDTCSRREKAVEAAKEAVAFAKKRCSKFPIFLGFVGPDDEESLRGILGVFEHPQAVPATAVSFQHSAITVDVVNTKERARRISTFLKYLNWYSFILIFTSDTVSSRVAESLLESDEFCLTNTILRVPSFASMKKDRSGINKVRRAVEGVQNVRIVILTDDADIMGYFTDYVEEEWGEFEFVVYTRTSGVLPWRSSTRMSRNAIVLQEVPKSPLILSDFEDTLRNSTLWLSYSNQLRCEGCKTGKIFLDTTVVPYVYSVHLFSRALRTATQKKCGPVLICDALKKMSPAEWRATLQDTVTVVQSHRISFYMVLDTQIDIVLLGDNTTNVVGYVENELIIHRPGVLKRLNRTKSKQCLVDMYEYELEQEEATTPKPGEAGEEDEEERVPINFGYGELLATAVGFPIALVVLIALTILCVYKSLRGSADNPRKSTLSTDSGVEDYS